MMRAAEALAVARIKRIPAVAPFLDVIGEHAVTGGRRLFAAPAGLDPLAPISRLAEDFLAPGTMLRREECGIGFFRNWLRTTRIEGFADVRPQGPDQLR